MRRSMLASLVFAACTSAPAWAQTPQPGTQAGGQGPAATTPAPVPAPVPGVPAGGDAHAVPEQIAPPAGTAGPADSTPFSATPSQQLPSGKPVILPRNGSGQSSPVPNLSK